MNLDVTVDTNWRELDEYDQLNPLYVIWEDAGGRRGGSMRTLPTLGQTMTSEPFRHLTHGVHVASPFIWECARFCLSPAAKPGVAAALLLAGCEMGLRFGLEHAIGVFDARMPRIYGRIGWMPDVIARRRRPRRDQRRALEHHRRGAARDRRAGRHPARLRRELVDTSFHAHPAQAEAA